MKRVLVAASLAALALSNAACGSDSSSSSQGSSSQDTWAAGSTTEAAAEATMETAAETAAEATMEAAPEAATELTTEALKDSAPAVPAWVESPSTVGGTCGTTPEGATAKAAGATSCGFAGVMYEKAKQLTFTLKQGASGNSLYQTGEFTVVSPTTQEEYTIGCRIGSDSSTITCEDPSDRSRGASFKVDSHNWPSLVTISEG